MEQQFKKMFEKEVPYFLEAWNKVREVGFFEEIEIKMRSGDDDSLTLTIRAFGYLPTESKYRLQGVSPYLDPEALLGSLRHQFPEGEFGIYHFSCQVKSEDWKLWNKDETSVIGRKGTEIFENLVLILKRK